MPVTFSITGHFLPNAKQCEIISLQLLPISSKLTASTASVSSPKDNSSLPPSVESSSCYEQDKKLYKCHEYLYHGVHLPSPSPPPTLCNPFCRVRRRRQTSIPTSAIICALADLRSCGPIEARVNVYCTVTLQVTAYYTVTRARIHKL
jgi:hypothetical protein